MKILATTITLFISTVVYSQTLKELRELEVKNQLCLDKGIDMIGCQISYHQQLDSILNLVYKKLRKSLSVDEKAALKTKQLKWLQERDTYFRKLEHDRDKYEIEIGRLAMYLSMNNYIEDRIIYLLNWQQKN